jgi:bisanhydrobacterioruberin hydratase
LIKNFSKDQIATAIALLFHTIGLVGILIFKSDLIIQSTPVNLLLSFALLIWTQKEKNPAFWLFIATAFVIGFTVEVIGVNTGLLFGNYSYGNVLGFKWQQVPLMIGINWVIIIYCCGIGVTALLQSITRHANEHMPAPANTLKAISVITDGATLAVLFDWLMEPVAVKLNFWQWSENDIPVYNFICWFFISLVLLALFHLCKFDKRNKFAVNLLLIQFLFFLILRTFLTN